MLEERGPHLWWAGECTGRDGERLAFKKGTWDPTPPGSGPGGHRTPGRAPGPDNGGAWSL